MGCFSINYSQDIVRGTLEVLESSELKKLAVRGMKVSIKPNMVLANPPSSGATTHKEVVEGLIRFLKDLGVSNIEIIESAWVGGNTKQAYHVCGYDELSRRYGVPLFDLKDDNTIRKKADRYSFEICRKALETDFLINVPVLKAHCQTIMTCCLKNIKGCISDNEKRRFHSLGLHRPIALLNTVVKTGFCLIDGICGDLTFEEGGTPVTRNMLLAGQDPLLLDSYCAGLIGRHPAEIEYLMIASDMGIGEMFSSDTKITELNVERKPLFAGTDSGTVRRLSAYINEDGACSACYSALIYALHTARNSPSHKINIGQGFRGKSGQFGCGNCTSGCGKYVRGCPPAAVDIAQFLKEIH